jgi:thermitase
VNPDWHLDAIGAKSAWRSGVKGAGVTIAVIDLGCSLKVPQISQAVAGAVSVCPQAGLPVLSGNGEICPDPHGTKCSSLAVGRGVPGVLNGLGLGVAPEAQLLPIAIPDIDELRQETCAQAIYYAVHARADIISCSLGLMDQAKTCLQHAVEWAATKGRRGYGTPIFWSVSNSKQPIRAGSIVAHPIVTAVGKFGWQSFHDGEFGERLAFVAPGAGVYTVTGLASKPIVLDDGTSFATACAAGAAALVLSAFKKLNRVQVIECLAETCDPLPGTNGRGRLRVYEALKYAQEKFPDLYGS